MAYEPNWKWFEQNAMAQMRDAYGGWEDALAALRQFGEGDFFDPAYRRSLLSRAATQYAPVDVGEAPTFTYDPFMAARVSAPLEAGAGAAARSARADALRAASEGGAFGGAGQARRAELAGIQGAQDLIGAITGARATGTQVATQGGLANVESASRAQALRAAAGQQAQQLGQQADIFNVGQMNEAVREALSQELGYQGALYGAASETYGARYNAMLNQLMSALGYGGEIGAIQAGKKKDIWDIIGTFL